MDIEPSTNDLNNLIRNINEKEPGFVKEIFNYVITDTNGINSNNLLKFIDSNIYNNNIHHPSILKCSNRNLEIKKNSLKKSRYNLKQLIRYLVFCLFKNTYSKFNNYYKLDKEYLDTKSNFIKKMNEIIKSNNIEIKDLKENIINSQIKSNKISCNKIKQKQLERQKRYNKRIKELKEDNNECKYKIDYYDKNYIKDCYYDIIYKANFLYKNLPFGISLPNTLKLSKKQDKWMDSIINKLKIHNLKKKRITNKYAKLNFHKEIVDNLIAKFMKINSPEIKYYGRKLNKSNPPYQKINKYKNNKWGFYCTLNDIKKYAKL